MRGRMIRRSRVRLGLLVVVAAAVLSTALVGSSAALPAGCSFDATSGTTSCVFSSTGAEQTFTVPAGVTSVHVVALGAAGGSGESGSGGGRGAVVSGDLSVSPAELLYV